MKYRIIFYVLVFPALFFQVSINGQGNKIQKANYYNVSSVRIIINNNADIKYLRHTGILTDKFRVKDNYLETIVDNKQIDILKNSVYSYKILVEDLTKDYLKHNAAVLQKGLFNNEGKNISFNYGSMGGYYTYDEVVKQLDTMHLLYPDLITKKDSIGRSVEGRAIWAVKISNNPETDGNNPQIFYNSLIHAREPEAMMSLMYFMYYLLENYGHDTQVTYLVDNRELYFIPVVNPDGYVYNEEISPNGGGFWRKNRRNNGNGVFGVDLNRNFGYMWGYDNEGSSPDSSSVIYRGKSPFSEPETEAIKNFCISHNFKIAINYHTFGNFVCPPWGYINKPSKDSAEFDNLISAANSLNNYKEEWPYLFNGSADDWMYGDVTSKSKIFSLTPEVGTSFWPTINEIIPIAKDNLYANLVYAWGPGILKDSPYPLTAKLDKSYLKPFDDSINIFINEPDSEITPQKLYAQILDEGDSVIDESGLNGSGSFSYSWKLNLGNEGFYTLRIKQSGTDIPFEFYSNNNRLTTAGPLVVDSTVISVDGYGWAYIKPFIRNLGSITIKNVSVSIANKDSIIISSYPKKLQLNDISPGSEAGSNTGFSINYDISQFPGFLKLKFEIGSGDFIYWYDSTKSVIADIDEKFHKPAAFTLYQNYPNPFNPATAIKYSVPQESFVTIKVYDVLGKEVTTLVNERKTSGNYSVNFNAGSLPSGVYFYRMRAGSFVSTKKFVLMK